MDRLAKIDRDELIRRLRSQFEQAITEVAQAVNDAPDGHLINASEERCRDVLGDFRRVAYETALQMRVQATEADPSFSPSESSSTRGGQPDDAELLRADRASPTSVRKPRRRHGRASG